MNLHTSITTHSAYWKALKVTLFAPQHIFVITSVPAPNHETYWRGCMVPGVGERN